MRIRDLLTADREAATVLWADCALTRPWNDPGDDFDRAHAGPASTILGSFEGDALTGTVMVGHDGHRGWVYYLAVDPTRRDRGIGRALMTAAESWLIEGGVPKLNLMVRHDNETVLSFYDRLGYQITEVTVLSRWLESVERPDDVPLTDQLIEELADEAEVGHDVAKILERRGRRGRPPLGSRPSTVEPVRLDPELKARLIRRAQEEGVPASEIIRDALRHHLDTTS